MGTAKKREIKYPAGHVRLVERLKGSAAALQNHDLSGAADCIWQAIDRLNKLERGRQNLIEQRSELYTKLEDAKHQALGIAETLGWEESY